MSEQLMKLEISANVVAWYGAIVATIGAAVAIYNAYRDRAQVSIKYRRDMTIRGTQNIYPKDKTYFNVTVVNKGRRPIRIEKAGLRVFGQKGKFTIFHDSFLPHREKVITEESPTTEFMIEQDEELLGSAWYIFVVDGIGRTYRKYLRVFPIVFLAKEYIAKDN